MTDDNAFEPPSDLPGVVDVEPVRPALRLVDTSVVSIPVVASASTGEAGRVTPGLVNEALRDSAARLAGLFDHAPTGCALVSREGAFRQVNGAFCRLLGYPEPSLLRRRLEEVTPPEDRAASRQVMDRLVTDADTHVAQMSQHYQHADGHLIAAVSHVSLVLDGHGQPGYFIFQIQDLSERTRATAALRDADDHAHLIMAAVKDYALLMLDPAGRVTSWNAGARRTKGYTADEILGRHFSVFYPPEAILRGHPEEELRIAATDGAFEEEGWRVRKDGTRFWASVVITALRDHAGTLQGFFKITRDITDRKQIQDALIAAKEAADASNRAKSEFLANMSHEIRTPMNGIMGMTNLVLDTTLTAEQREYLGLVKDSADALLTVINDILDYSKIEAGKLVIDNIPFVLADSVGDTVHTLSHRAHEKGLELAYDVHAEVPPVLIGDPGRLRQILVNLVGNAIKFTHTGEVILSVHVASRTTDAVELQWTVADTGIGIDATQHTAIFEAFTQADGSTTRTYGGTGLGLTIAARFVALMGGRVWVDSEVGHGSRFHFTVWMGIGAVSAPLAGIQAADATAVRGMTVLIVDDNATNRQILVKTLGTWGLMPTAVASGAAALAVLSATAARGERLPLILLDAQMPEMDGFTFAAVLAAHPTPALATATIMMLSSAGQRGDAERCRALGMVAYLTKPVRPRELFEAILIAVATPTHKPISIPLVTRHALRERRTPLRVLLAEDVPVNQLLVVRFLEREGHVVTVVVNGHEVLAALERRAFDVVLMDVQMPGMDGLEATEAIRRREQRSGDHVPIIAMTAHAMSGDRERCLKAGMDGYLAKPIGREALLNVLEPYCQQAPPQGS